MIFLLLHNRGVVDLICPTLHMPVPAGFWKHDKTESNERSFSKHAVLTKKHKSKISLYWLQKTAFWISCIQPRVFWAPYSLETKTSLSISDNCVIWVVCAAVSPMIFLGKMVLRDIILCDQSSDSKGYRALEIRMSVYPT